MSDILNFMDEAGFITFEVDGVGKDAWNRFVIVGAHCCYMFKMNGTFCT